MDSIVAVIAPNDDTLSLNSQVIKRCLTWFESARKDGDFSYDPSNESNEAELATQLVSDVTTAVNDFEKDNIYHYEYSVELVYSRLRGNDYSYKTTESPLNANNYQQALKLREEIRADSPKEYQDDNTYTLEDVRLGEKLVDLHGKNPYAPGYYSSIK
jgi:hypothetical protein